MNIFSDTLSNSKGPYVLRELMKGVCLRLYYVPESSQKHKFRMSYMFNLGFHNDIDRAYNITDHLRDYCKEGIKHIYDHLVETKVITKGSTVEITGMLGGGSFYGKYDVDSKRHSRPFMYFPYDVFLYHEVLTQDKDTSRSRFLNLEEVEAIPETMLRRAPILRRKVFNLNKEHMSKVYPSTIHNTLGVRIPNNTGKHHRIFGIVAIHRHLKDRGDAVYNVLSGPLYVPGLPTTKQKSLGDLLEEVDDTETLESFPEELLED